MNIKFVFNLAYKTPFFYELLDELNGAGHEVILYDLISAKKYIPKSRKMYSFNPFFGAKWILKIKYFRRLFIPLINRLTIKKEFNSCDIVNIHYVHVAYIQYTKILKENSSKLITTFWGSDILRANETTINKYLPLLNESNCISMVIGIQNRFKEIYPQFAEKIQTSYFGLNLLDKIRIIDKDTIKKFKIRYDIDDGYIYVTVGYNASPAQQHTILINKLMKIHIELKEQIFLLIPLTYGGSNDYIEKLIRNLGDLGIKFKVFTNFLSDVELSTLRVLSDITLNIQKTDAFSASISESIAANSIVLTGDWLPYDIYRKWGVNIFQSDLESFEGKITNLISRYDFYKNCIKGNSQILYKKLSWKYTLPLWEQLFLMENK